MTIEPGWICIGQIRDAGCRKGKGRAGGAVWQLLDRIQAGIPKYYLWLDILLSFHTHTEMERKREGGGGKQTETQIYCRLNQFEARCCVKIVNTTKHCTFYALSMGTCSSKLLTWKMLVNITYFWVLISDLRVWHTREILTHTHKAAEIHSVFTVNLR